MSRVLFVSLSEDEVIAKCVAANVRLSAIEALPQGGVRLVCKSREDTTEMMARLKRHLIQGDVVRARHRPTSPLW